MATHEAFDEDWTSYTDCMKHLFIPNNVRKGAILLSTCGIQSDTKLGGERQVGLDNVLSDR